MTVVEKNDFTGGRCSLIHKEGHRFDQGPSLLLLPDLFQEAFVDLDTTLEAEGIELRKCEPNYNVWFGDGECIELSTDIARMKKTIERWEGKEGFERYMAWLKEAHVHYEVGQLLSVKTHKLIKSGERCACSAQEFHEHVEYGTTKLSALSTTATSIREHLGKSFALFLERTASQSFHLWKHVHGHEPFRRTWYIQLTAVHGTSRRYLVRSAGHNDPARASELINLSRYPRGGFQTVLEALVKVGERFGVDYRLSVPISQVNVDKYTSRATGVTLASGEILNADIVLMNADLVYAYNNLLPPSPEAAKLSAKPASCSSISFYWSVDKVVPELHTHNVFLADDYKDSFDDIFKRQLIPKEPSFYVNVPSRVDPSAAPDGKDTIVVLVPCGHLLEGRADRGLNPHLAQDWDAMVARARDAVLETIQIRTGADIRPHIYSEMVNTPSSWKETFNLDKGAILGLSHSFFNVLSFRPKTKHASIKDLYFVGASTHPGTGVPIVLAGSKITTSQILDDLNMIKPWSSGNQGRRHVSSLDNESRVPFDLIHILGVIAAALLVVVFYFTVGKHLTIAA